MASEVEFVSETNPLVVLNYQDLVDGKDLSKAIETAYGNDGLGILVVRGIPNFAELRQKCLPLAWKFAHLDDKVKNKYMHKESQYSFGWSHGVEFLMGKPDFRKGSFYANPCYDRPFDDEEIIKKYSPFAHPNIWPKEELPELEHAFKALGSLMVEVGGLLAKHIDKLVKSRCPSYPDNRLEQVIKNGRCHKGRLLHYFPPDYEFPEFKEWIDREKEALAKQKLGQVDQKDKDEDYFASWCGWHNDHGSLTALCCAMFINEKGEEVANPIPENGLYIKDRKGNIVKGVIPPDCLALQIGETQQVHAGGFLQATPHCVHVTPDSELGKGISRETLAVFMEPNFDDDMSVPEGVDPSRACVGSEFFPKGVPTMASRWQNGQTFAQFTEKTLSAYYDIGCSYQKEKDA